MLMPPLYAKVGKKMRVNSRVEVRKVEVRSRRDSITGLRFLERRLSWPKHTNLLNVACSGPGVSRTRNLSVTNPILYQ